MLVSRGECSDQDLSLIGQRLGHAAALVGIVFCKDRGRAERWIPPLPPEEIPMESFWRVYLEEVDAVTQRLALPLPPDNERTRLHILSPANLLCNGSLDGLPHRTCSRCYSLCVRSKRHSLR